MNTALPFGMDEEDLELELPVLPPLQAATPPDCPFCGEPMTFIDAEWGCADCNGELIGPETG